MSVIKESEFVKNAKKKNAKHGAKIANNFSATHAIT